MGKLRRRDVEPLDRAVAFDRTVDRARVYSPSLFPPEITCKKYILDDGACEHVFHHRTLGELGRFRIEDRSGSTHIGGLVTGIRKTYCTRSVTPFSGRLWRNSLARTTGVAFGANTCRANAAAP